MSNDAGTPAEDRDEGDAGDSTADEGGRGVDDRYRMLVEQNLVGISLIQDGRFVFVNPRMEEILGRSREELVEADPAELIHPEDRESAVEQIERLLAGETEEAQFSTELPHADGPRYVDVHLKRTEYGSEPALLGVTADVTERARAERARETSERLFRAVFENALDGILIADDDGVVVDANSAAGDVFGVEQGTLVGRTLEDFDAVDLDFEGPWGIFRGAGADRGVLRVVRPDGEQRVVEYATTGDILPGRHLSILRDVTERRRQEEALAEERERLDFMNALLRHHVLNGMNIIIGLADHLQSDAEGRDAERLETISRRGDAIVELIETMRSIIRSIRGQEAPGFDTVDVADLLEDAVEDAAATHPSADVHLEDLPPSLPVYADDMLAAVFDDLLDNAVRHNDAPSPTVEVWVEVDEETVTVHVADDGPGVPASVREELFEEGTASSSSGFGLNIVHLLVTLYDGAMEIADREPSGTIVTVSLPRA